MGVSWKWIIELLVKVLGPVIAILSPMISQALKDALLDLYKKALATPNPWDDFVVGFLLDILSIPRPTQNTPIV